MFRRLQTKLSVLYGALFGVLLTLVGVAAYGTIAHNAERAIRNELQASGTVFDRIWALRAHQLQDSARLLAHDFGFRSAVATQDQATTQSALDNLRVRLGLDKAFIVRTDGSVSGLDARQIDGGINNLSDALDDRDGAAGVTMIGGEPYEAVSATIMAPNMVGWVVFAARLDRADLSSLERLSALPIHAELIELDRTGHWRPRETKAATSADLRAIDAFAANAAKASGTPRRLDLNSGAAIALAKPLKTLGAHKQTALLLRYPLAAALAPYRPMLAAVAILGGLSLLALLVGSWILARSLTRPLSALDEAVHRLTRGEEAQVEIASGDEVGRLAVSFNRMAAEIRERERRITHLALHDPETEMLNRRALIQMLEALIAERKPGIVVVAALGVERFAFVRSAIGYSLTGGLLSQLAARIVDRHADMRPARLATGILGVAFRSANLDEALALLEGLTPGLEEPVRLGATTVDVGLRIGVAACPVHAEAAAELLDRANIALDQVGGAGKLAVFDRAAYGDPASNLSLMSEMLDAIGSGELMVYYQPKLDLRSGAICGAEALVRWRHPARGMLPPDLFVGMAEETGHIRELSDWVLDQAITDQKALLAAGRDLMISVNLSGRLVGDADYAAQAIRQITESGARVCFELTETAVIENPEKALQLVEGYAAAGVPISIDDYGSGLSSLFYLKQIAAQELKIDKAFILGLAEGTRDALLVKSTIDLAHALGMKVTAEGVEDAAILSALTVMGCDVAQGYYIARPMPLEALFEFLARQADAPAVQALAVSA